MSIRHVLVAVTPAYHPRLAGIARFAHQRGWQLTILDRIARRPCGWTGDGVIITLRDNPEQLAFVRAIRKRRIPVVDLSFNHPKLRVPRVSGDHFAFGVLARRHLEERNFRHFAWFSTDWLNIHRLRYKGFANNEEIPCWVFAQAARAERRDDFAWFNRWLGAKLRDAPKPLGLLCYDDADAARAEGACRANGLSVPEDVAIIGIGGDRLICENQPVPLSSIEHDQGRTGYEGAELLERLMNGEAAPTQPILIPPRGLTIRASTDILSASSPIVRCALNYIRVNLGESFGLEQIAQAISTPRTTLTRLFRQELKRSVGDEILRQRLERAKRLLETRELTIAEIAYRAGFCNPGYFTNTFRKVLGVSPKVWQAAHAQNEPHAKELTV